MIISKKQKKLEKKNKNFRSYSVFKNIERIADALTQIAASQYTGSIEIPAYIKYGLSKICQNTYAENIRTDEIIKLIKELYPNERGAEK